MKKVSYYCILIKTFFFQIALNLIIIDNLIVFLSTVSAGHLVDRKDKVADKHTTSAKDLEISIKRI